MRLFKNVYRKVMRRGKLDGMLAGGTVIAPPVEGYVPTYHILGF